MTRKTIDTFHRDEAGAMTVLGLFLIMTCFVIGGLALDVANAYMARTQLQAAADAVGHAAIYNRDSEDEAEAIARARAVGEVMMPNGVYGDVLRSADIRFGNWDPDTRQFEVESGSNDAVWVDMTRGTSRSNSVGTYFLSFAGIGSWDVRRGSVWETYIPTCFREGFVADGRVDVQSNNVYTNGFCIHSNSHVEVQNNNFYASNTVVSMPDRQDLVLPNNGWESNEGLADALRDASYQIRILSRVQDIIDDLYDVGDTYTPDYITGTATITLTAKTVDASDFTPNRVHTKSCSGNQKVTIKAGTTLQNVVFVTDCVVNFGNNVILENVIIATENTSDNSVSASHVQVGKDDECDEDGGSQIITMGGFTAASGLKVYGGQIIAMKDIDFAANANGIEGASFIAGGEINGTSNMTMGFCGSGMERNFEAEYFRLVS